LLVLFCDVGPAKTIYPSQYALPGGEIASGIPFGASLGLVFPVAGEGGGAEWSLGPVFEVSEDIAAYQGLAGASVQYFSDGAGRTGTFLRADLGLATVHTRNDLLTPAHVWGAGAAVGAGMRFALSGGGSLGPLVLASTRLIEGSLFHSVMMGMAIGY
jgi:hypothetical protein